MSRKGTGEGLDTVIGVRLPAELKAQFQREANQLKIPIGSHIRGLLQPYDESAEATDDGYVDGYKKGREEGIHHGFTLVREAVTEAVAKLAEPEPVKAKVK